MRQDRGVSEVLGYVLVISIVTMMIGTVMTVGVAGLHDTQTAEQTNNMERAYDVLADNFAQMYIHEAPSRATEIRLLDGHLRYGDQVTINITIDGDPMPDLRVDTRPLVYDNEDGTTIVYEAGAVIREDENQSVMLHNPELFTTGNRTMVSLVRTRPRSGSDERMGGPRTILVESDGLTTTVLDEPVNDSERVNITVTSPRTDAWERSLSELDVENPSVRVGDEEVSLTFDGSDGDVVTMIRHRLRVTFRE